MDEEVEDVILDAWERVRPKLESDPVELAKRLARMRGASLSRPPRAWGLAIRSSDRRIDAARGCGCARRSRRRWSACRAISIARGRTGTSRNFTRNTRKWTAAALLARGSATRSRRRGRT